MKQMPRAPMLLHTFRPHAGTAMLNQVRNNGLRALRDRAGLHGNDLIIILDGDTMLAPDAIQKHKRAADGGADLIIPFRFMIDEEATATVSPADVIASGIDSERLVTSAMRDELRRLDRRYRMHLLLSRIGLTKAHKPKIIGGHHAVRFNRFVDVNGFDEEFNGYGFDDDDLCRRLRQCRPPTRIAVNDIHAYHLWHPVRAPRRMKESSGYARWIQKDFPVRCVRGLENGMIQQTPNVELIG
jgi:hypothetical protein